MPGEIKLEFLGARGGQSPAKSVYAWLMGEVSPALAALHDAREYKPFTVDAWDAQEGNAVRARITIMQVELFTEVLTALQNTPRAAINGEWCEVGVKDSHFIPAAGLFDGQPVRKVEVFTLTPVVFRKNGHYQSFLTPERLFTNIRERYLHFEGVEAPSIYSPNLDLMLIDGRTEHIYAHGVCRGWVGRMIMELHDDAAACQRMMGLLTYGWYAGVGAKTTAGAGRIDFREARDSQTTRPRRATP